MFPHRRLAGKHCRARILRGQRLADFAQCSMKLPSVPSVDVGDAAARAASTCAPRTAHLGPHMLHGTMVCTMDVVVDVRNTARLARLHGLATRQTALRSSRVRAVSPTRHLPTLPCVPPPYHPGPLCFRQRLSPAPKRSPSGVHLTRFFTPPPRATTHTAPRSVRAALGGQALTALCPAVATICLRREEEVERAKVALATQRRSSRLAP
jgi:hypothetical protein